LVVERAAGKKGEKRASGVKRARHNCQSCGWYSHVTSDCWNLPSNAHKQPAYYEARLEEEDVVDDKSLTADVSEQNYKGNIGTAN
jgi:hypothetical protein